MERQHDQADDRAQTFLDAFARIERWIRLKADADNSIGFSELVKSLSGKNRIIDQYSRYLRDFSDLRNAIVHAPRFNGQPIADPRMETVLKILEVEDKILRPRTVEDAKFIHPVYSVAPGDTLAPVLEQLASNDYSQAPVVEDGELRGLLTREGIAYWLGKLAIRGETIMCTDEVTVSDVMEIIDAKDNYKVIGRKASLVEVRDRFVDAIGRPVPLEALLITSNGKRDGGLVGIVTRSEDLSVLMKYI